MVGTFVAICHGCWLTLCRFWTFSPNQGSVYKEQQMNKLTLYLGKTVLVSIILTLLFFVGLEFIFSLVNEVRLVGTGDYSLGKVLAFILLSIPQSLAVLFPMAALLGTLMGLGVLAGRSELVVIRAAGWSIGNIVFAISKLALLLALTVMLVQEKVVPITDKWARQQKAWAMSSGQTLNTGFGTWMRDGKDFIYIKTVESNSHLEGITIYRFDDNMRLLKMQEAAYADFDKGHYVLHDIKETLLTEDKVLENKIQREIWQSHINPEILQVAGVKDLEDLTLSELHQTIQYRKANALNYKGYQLIFWQKLLRPLAILVMMFVAIPFLFGPLRSTSMGLRLLAGVLIGFVFYLFNQLFGPLTQVYPIHPFIGAILPTLLFFGFGVYLCKRTL
jgi:lipopolysaccharide export system permease protein